jgi:hypothetical protein
LLTTRPKSRWKTVTAAIALIAVIAIRIGLRRPSAQTLACDANVGTLSLFQTLAFNQKL